MADPDLHLLEPRSDPLDLDALAAAYAYPTDPPHGRWVRANMVSTLDGRAAGGDGLSGSINTGADGRVFATLRALCDVVLVGSSTMRAEGYGPMELDEDAQAVRRRAGLSGVPVYAVLTGHAATVADGMRDASVTEPPNLVYDAGIGAAVNDLTRRGLVRILCEGGPHILAQAADAGVLDELCLTLAPTLLAGDPMAITAGDSLDPPWPAVLHHAVRADDSTLLLSYRCASVEESGRESSTTAATASSSTS